ncbi:hypothetical protein CRM22_002496 [Opisthorchis felineus]|uniref:UBC core domain-containing protein n=2 Tax=Opisthorchis felineus TaxID=147828 RepID=A0A4S2M5S5_OPIFE|nr:hypothetical protein CRM22_002496 [Opisthorchis felineus]
MMLTQGYLLVAEYNLLRLHHPAGIFVMPDTQNPLLWSGVVSVRSGYYTGGIFDLRLQIPSDFPSHELPRVYLPKGFFHPYVQAQTGELSITSAFSRWQPDRHHLWHVLHHVRSLLTSPTSCIREHSAEQIHMLTRSSIYPIDPADSSCMTYPNPEAADLIVNHKTLFEARARTCVMTLSLWSPSYKNGVDPLLDVHPISIDGWQDSTFIKRARERMKLEANPPPPDTSLSRGFSWIDTSTMTIFSNEPNNSKHGNL